MPKEFEEIKAFHTGIIGSPSGADIPKESAAYSSNVDANLQQGSLIGVQEDLILSSSGWKNKRKTSTVFSINYTEEDWNTVIYPHLTDKYMLIPTYKSWWLVYFSEDATKTSYENIDSDTYQMIISNYENVQEYRISSYPTLGFFWVDFKSFIESYMKPPTDSFEYKEVSTDYMSIDWEGLDQDDIDWNNGVFKVRLTNHFYGEINNLNVYQSNINSTYVSNHSSSNTHGVGQIDDFFQLNWIKVLEDSEGHTLAFLNNSGQFGAYENFYTESSTSNIVASGVSNAGRNKITAEQRNNDLYLGVGGLPTTPARWYGKINRKQLERDLDGSYFTIAALKKPPRLDKAYEFDRIIVPTLNKDMSSINGMIAGAASLYCGGTVGTDFGGADVEADASINDYRSLNGWIMKCLSNAGHAYQDDYTAATDDAHFDWDASVKRGMIFRVSIGNEGDAQGFSVIQDSTLGAPAAGEAIFELRKIKEIGFGDTSAVTASAEGVELHDGDLFQVVTSPETGTDSLAQSNGDVATYPRLMYVGSLSGTSTLHNSTTAAIPAPAWAYGMFNNSSMLYRIALSECNDDNIASTETMYTYSNVGATGNTTSSEEFLKRTTSIDLAHYINTPEFKLGTIAECLSTDGMGGIGGRVSEEDLLTVDTVTRCNSVGVAGTAVTDIYVKFHTTADHKYIVGDWIRITNSDHHNGKHQIVWADADEFVILNTVYTDTDNACNVLSFSRNYYAGHGKIWVTSSNPIHYDKLWLVDVVNWHGVDADSGRVTAKEFRLDFDRIHSSLESDNEGEGLLESPYWDRAEYDAQWNATYGWIDPYWSSIPNNGFPSAICETYSHRPHLDDGAHSSHGCGRWRVWVMYSKTDDATFNNWDLFLYNFRPTDTGNSDSKLWMYDKTPPFQEVGQVIPGAYTPKDKFMVTRGTPHHNDRYLGHGIDEAQHDGNGITYIDSQRQFWSETTDLFNASNMTNVPGDFVLNAGEIYDTKTGGTNTEPSNAKLRRNGGHLIIKDTLHSYWDQGTNHGKPMRANSRGAINNNLEHGHIDNVQGGLCYKDPSGMWHMIELPYYRGDISGLNSSTYGDDTHRAQHSLHMGYNTGWTRDGLGTPLQNHNARSHAPTRHCLVPYYSQWWRIRALEVEDIPGGNDEDVAHIVTFSSVVSGKFVQDAGSIKATYMGGAGSGKALTWQGVYASSVRGSTLGVMTYDSEAVLCNMHDSPVAFTSSDLYGNMGFETDSVSDLDGVTDWSGSGGTGIDEVQGRPTKATDDAGTADLEAGTDTNNGVRATLGYSKFNQYRWGHDFNGTHDLHVDDYTTDNAWNTWDSYKGQDGYGHYNMITTTWCSIAATSSRGYVHNQGDYGDGENSHTFGGLRMRHFNVDQSGYSTHDGMGGKGYGTFSGSRGEGTGYFTWYTNMDNYQSSIAALYATQWGDRPDGSGNGSEGDPYEVDDPEIIQWGRYFWKGTDRGWYDSSSSFQKDISGNLVMTSTVDDGSDEVPGGTQWQNRRINFCWSIVPFLVGGSQNSTGSPHAFLKAPRVSQRKINAYTSTYTPSGTDERTHDIKVHALDNYATYYDLNSLNTYTSCIMIYTTAPDLNDNLRTMILVVIPAHGNGDNNSSDAFEQRLAHKWSQGLRPLRLGSAEQARRMFYNEKITGKNLCHAILDEGNTYDIYCPLIWGSSKNNDSSMVLMYRRSQWPTMSTSAAGPSVLHYLFDKFYDYEDVANCFAGFDNADGALNTRFPLEQLGSYQGTGTGTSSTVSGDSDDDGCHLKTSIQMGFTVTSGGSTTGSTEFLTGDIVEYKLSYLYDGYQDGPLTSWVEQYDNGTALTGNIDHMICELELARAELLDLNPRITDVVVWRRNNETDYYRLVKQVNLAELGNTPETTDLTYISTFKDRVSYKSYEATTGLSETLDFSEMNFGTSAQIEDFLFVGDVWHRSFTDAGNTIFRSMPGNFSQFNWATDFLALPTKPLALASFAGKLWAFSREKIYRINPSQFFIESVQDGIGILNQNSLVVTDYGMFFCDKNSMYQHDGTKPVDIGGTVLFNQDNPETTVGYRAALDKCILEGIDPIVAYDGRHKCVYFMIQGIKEVNSDTYTKTKSGIYTYYPRTGRFDYIIVDYPCKFAVLGRDGDTLLSTQYQLFSLRRSTLSSKAWSWTSKEFDMGTLNVDKVWKSIKLTGSPSFANFSSLNNVLITDDVQVFIDGHQKKLTIDNRNYSISKPIASSNVGQAKGSTRDDGTIYGIQYPLPSPGSIGHNQSYVDSFSLYISSMPEFNSGTDTFNKDYVKKGDMLPGNPLKYISVGNYLYFEVYNEVTNQSFGEIVKVKEIFLTWDSSTDEVQKVQISCDRGELESTPTDFTQFSPSDGWVHAPIRYVGPSLKLPGRTKGKKLQVVLKNQTGTVDSVSFIYRLKTLK